MAVRWKCIILLCPLFLGGCAGLFRSSASLRPIPSDVLVQRLHRHAGKLQTFIGEGRVTVVTTEGGFRGGLGITSQLPDSLFMKVEGPLGVDVMLGQIGGGRFTFYYPRDQLAYTGSIQAMHENSLLPLDLGVAEMARGALGLFLQQDLTSSGSVTLSDDVKQYILTMDDGQILWVDPDGPVVTRWERRDEAEELLWTWEGSRHVTHRGIRLPRMVRVTQYQPTQQVTLFFEKIRVNRSLKQGWSNVTLPEGVEPIEL